MIRPNMIGDNFPASGTNAREGKRDTRWGELSMGRFCPRTREKKREAGDPVPLGLERRARVFHPD